MRRVFLHAALHNVFTYIVIFNLTKTLQEIYIKEGEKGQGKRNGKGKN